MKQLELNLQKRLLIVETDNIMVVGQYEAEVNGRHIELICKCSELTEDMLSNIVIGGYCSTNGKYLYKNYNSLYDDECFNYALESFISAIEAQGYYWGENPIIKPSEYELWAKYGDFTQYGVKLTQQCRPYFEAESKTFSPSKTLIFKIIE